MRHTKIMTDYEKSCRRGELMVARYAVEHATYDRVADLIADLMAYCEDNDINFTDELIQAELYINDERAAQ